MSASYGNVNTPFKRGQTFYQGNVPSSNVWSETIWMEGRDGEFTDVAPRTTPGSQIKRSGRPQLCKIVRNTSGIALKPSRAVQWETGYRNRRVDGYQATQYGEIAGFVDEHLPAAGVAANDLFWLVVGGQVTMVCDSTSNTIAQGNDLNAASGTSSLNDDAGRVEASAVTSGDTDVQEDQMFHRVGVAVSAKAATETSGKKILAECAIVT